MKKFLSLFLACVISTPIALTCALSLGGCTGEKLPPMPQWDESATLTDNGVQLNIPAVEDAEEYDVYYSPSRHGEYTLVSSQTSLKYEHEDSYGYFRIDAKKGDEVIDSQLLSYEMETFGANTYIYSPDDDNALINADIQEKFTILEAGQFSKERFGVLFKEGKYPEVKMQTGYYTTVAGMGLSPKDVTLGYFNVNAQWFNGNATHNFWRGIENFTVEGNIQWAVSQATSFRRMNITGNVQLDDGGWSSGGYIADSAISGNINSGGQQQWFTRNSTFTRYNNGGWSRVFVGCEGAVPGGAWPSGRSTNIDNASYVKEKPFLIFDNGYEVFIPQERQNATGVSWSGEDIIGDYIPLSHFYVARADRDTSQTLNAALKNGKHLLLTAGIYELDQPLLIEKENTVVMGMGLATLKISDNNTDTLMRVYDVGGVNISGILFDAGKYSSTLLEVGEEGANLSHQDNKICLSDLYFRVGGAERKSTSVDVCMIINSNDVVGDHFWVWRADHSYGVGWKEGAENHRGQITEYENATKNGVIINGDNATVYALMVEHFHEYQTIWNGENGYLYFYQSEAPYDAIQDDWMSNDGETLGYASYKVSDDVISHHAYGVGVYGYPSGSFMYNAIEASNSQDVYFEHIVTIMLSGSRPGGIYNVINGLGGAVSASQFDRTIEYFYGGEIQKNKSQ